MHYFAPKLNLAIFKSAFTIHTLKSPLNIRYMQVFPMFLRVSHEIKAFESNFMLKKQIYINYITH